MGIFFIIWLCVGGVNLLFLAFLLSGLVAEKRALRKSKRNKPHDEDIPEPLSEIETLFQVYPEPARPSIPPRLTLPITGHNLPAVRLLSGKPISLPVTPIPTSAQASTEEPPRLYVREPISFLVGFKEQTGQYKNFIDWSGKAHPLRRGGMKVTPPGCAAMGPMTAFAAEKKKTIT